MKSRPLSRRRLFDALAAEILRPDLAERMIEEAMAALRNQVEHAATPGHRDACRAERQEVQAQIQRLLDLVKLAGSTPTIAEEIATLERRRERLEVAEQPPVLPTALDRERLRQLLGEWRDRIRGEMPVARQVLRVLFPTRIVFTPDADQQTVEVSRTCALGNVFERLLVPQTVMTPAGFEPAFTVRHALS